MLLIFPIYNVEAYYFEENSNDVYLSINCCELTEKCDYEDKLALLNAGLIEPIYYDESFALLDLDVEFMPISPQSWPWTDCSNLFGHSWGGWTNWYFTGGGVHGSVSCTRGIRRDRTCSRTYCNAQESEYGLLIDNNCPC